MASNPKEQKDPIQAQLEAALEAMEGLDLDVQIDARPQGPKGPLLGGGRGEGRGEGRSGGGGRGASRSDGGNDLRQGTIVGVEKGDVIVDLGPRMQGVIDSSEFDEPPTVGEQHDFTLHGQKDGLWILSRRRVRALAAWGELEPGATVSARVMAKNSGGLELLVGTLSAFMPASQASDRHIEDLGTLVGQTFDCVVMEVDPDRRRLVVSRRRALERDKSAKREEVSGKLAVGARVKGTVMRLEPYGAFIDIGGVEGLAHVSQLAHQRVRHPEEVLKVGQQVEAEILSIDEGARRIGLGLKQLESDPWGEVARRYSEGAVAKVRVVRLEVFGAFCELEPGIEGLLHVSQMGNGGDRTRRVQDMVAVGQEFEVRVVAVDPVKKRLGLSRMDSRGAVLGSEDAVDQAEIQRVLSRPEEAPKGTNLGNLFKNALKPK